MHTLTVTLADLEGVTHGTTAAHTSVKVSARYSREVILADGTIIPVVIKNAAIPGDGVAAFSVFESDSTLVDPDYQGFGIVVEATVMRGHAEGGTFRRTVKVLESAVSPVSLGSLPPAEGLPAKWVSVADFTTEVTAAAAAAGVAAVNARISPGKNQLDVTQNYGADTRWTEANTLEPVPTVNYTAGRVFPVTAGEAYTGTKISNYSFFDVSGTRLSFAIDGDWNTPMTVTAPAGATTLAVSWATSQQAAAMVEAGAVATTYEPFELTIPAYTPPDPVPFPSHTYIDAWTSHVFDDGKNVWIPGQPVTATTASAAAAGATTLTVASTTIVPGMSMVTNPTSPDAQTVRVQSVSGSTLTLAAPLRHPIASGQRLDALWQNASHLSASSGANFGGYAALAKYVFDALAGSVTTAPAKVTLLANSWAVQGSLQWSTQAGVTFPGAVFVNAGIGGNTTAQMLARFDTDVPADSDTVILFESVNDTYQGTRPDVQDANWRALVDKVHGIGAWPVVVGPPPLNGYPAETLAQEHATAARAFTSLATLRLERDVAELQGVTT